MANPIPGRDAHRLAAARREAARIARESRAAQSEHRASAPQTAGGRAYQQRLASWREAEKKLDGLYPENRRRNESDAARAKREERIRNQVRNASPSEVKNIRTSTKEDIQAMAKADAGSAHSAYWYH